MRSDVRDHETTYWSFERQCDECENALAGFLRVRIPMAPNGRVCYYFDRSTREEGPVYSEQVESALEEWLAATRDVLGECSDGHP